MKREARIKRSERTHTENKRMLDNEKATEKQAIKLNNTDKQNDRCSERKSDGEAAAGG